MARHGVGFRETDTPRGRAPRDPSANERRVLRGVDERGGGAKAVRLEDLRHLGDRQPFGKRDVHRRTRRRARSCRAPLPASSARRTGTRPLSGGGTARSTRARRDTSPVTDEAGGDEPIADRAGAGAGRDVDELFGAARIHGTARARANTSRPRRPTRPARRPGGGAPNFFMRGAVSRPSGLRSPIQIILQDDRGGRGVELRLAPAPVALAARQAALRFAARQTLVLGHDRHARARAAARRRSRPPSASSPVGEPSRRLGRPTTIPASPSSSAGEPCDLAVEFRHRLGRSRHAQRRQRPRERAGGSLIASPMRRSPTSTPSMRLGSNPIVNVPIIQSSTTYQIPHQ